MNYKGRVQALVTRNNKILMVKHTHIGDSWYCSPGGGIELGEPPEQTALRELQEECNVTGKITKKINEYADPYDDSIHFYTFQIDIGDQTPALGCDPEILPEKQILTEVRWVRPDEISEVDRAFLWASGLLSIPYLLRKRAKHMAPRNQYAK